MNKIVLIACLFLVGAQIAVANDARLDRLVKFDDLNLEDKDHAKVLYFRLVRAAKKVCSVKASTDLNGRVHFKSCMDRVVASAVLDIKHPNVSHQHFVRTGEHVPPVAVANR